MFKTAFFLSILVLILSVRFIFFFQNKHEYRVGEEVRFSHTFLKDPQKVFGKQTFNVSNIKIYASGEPELKYGQKVSVKGVVEEERFKNSKGKEVVRPVIKNPKIDIVENRSGLSLISGMRSRISEVFQKNLSRNESSLLMGIVFGIREGMDKELSQAFRNTGVLHVVAASGANVSLVGGFLLAMFTYFLKRQIGVVCACLAIIFYAVFSGLEASIVRASIMAILAFSATIFGRQNFALITLSFTAFLMLFYNPELYEDAGFQLSFASTTGILYIKPVFSRLPRKLTALTDDFSTTFAAQLASLPILVITFSSYSPISILVNTLVLWTIPPLMVLGGLAALLSLILPILSVPFLYLSMPLLLFFEKMVMFWNGTAKPVETASIPVSLVVGYYLMLGSIVLLVKKNHES